MGVLKSLFSLASVLLLSRGVLGVTVEESLGTPSPISVESTRYIVKFSQAGSAKFKRDDGSHDTSEFYSTLEDSGKDVTPSLTFNSGIFQGVSFDMRNASNDSLAEIEALPDVDRVWPAALYHTPVDGTASVVGSSSRLKYSAWSAHNDTNVAAMHEAGHFGEDVIIAIVDSGIDYTHPALGGGFGRGYRVESGYDFVGDDYVVGGEYVPDDDPMDCLGHGTHVAGIAASGDSYLPGVAPKARLRSYKVFGCGDGTYEDVIVAALLKAYEDGADVINASLGSNQGFPDTATALVATSIAAAGVFVAIAAGNSGATGPFYTSSGGNGRGSLAVGSVQAQDWVAYQVTATSSNGETREIPYLSDTLTQFKLNGSLTASPAPNVRNSTACEWMDDAATPSDSVLVIRKGDCGWQLQDSTLIGKATSVFYIQTEGDDWERIDRARYRDDQPNNAGLILYEDGDWLISQIEDGNDVTFEFIQNNEAIAIPRSGFAGGRINDFSSWGPTLDARMKPEISAPGGSILSTWPVSSGSWATYSGTSMASPYIAGVGALFFGSRGGRATLGPDAAKIAVERIISSGRPVKHNDGTDNLASVAKQGSGLVDAATVILSGTSVSPANLNLNDTVHFKATHEVVLTNANAEAVTYEVAHESGITIHTKNNGDAWVATEPPYSSDVGEVAEVSFSFDTITLSAGESATLHIEFVEPETVSASYLPVYGGRILLAGSNGDVVSVTYMGIKGSIYASDTWEMERGIPLLLSGYGGLMEEGHNYTWEDGSDVPSPYFNILWSTRELSFDYVTKDWQPSDWAYPPVAGKNNWVGSIRMRPSALDGSVVDFPLKNYPRVGGSFSATPQGYFANGSSIPSGEYRLLCRVIRTFGDFEKLDDWQYKLSPWFRISREADDGESTSTTSAVATSTNDATASDATTTSAAPVCTSGAPRPISLKAYVGDADEGHEFYPYSDFLAVDLSDERSHFGWKLTDDGHLQTSSNNADVFAAVHTNTNSLVYMYTASRIAGSWSHLQCSVIDGILSCESGEKANFYICETDSALVRHGTSVLDGCTAITIKVEDLPDPCAATSATIDPSTTSNEASTATSAVPQCSGTSHPVQLEAKLGDDENTYGLQTYSDFMAIDLSGGETDMDWNYVDNAYLQTTINGNTVYAAVHTNTNSLIYLYQSSRISPPFSYLDCVTNDDGTLSCVSGEKTELYVCDSDRRILRHGTTVLDNCTPVTFTIRRLCRTEDDGTASLTSSSVYSTSTTSVISFTTTTVSSTVTPTTVESQTLSLTDATTTSFHTSSDSDQGQPSTDSTSFWDSLTSTSPITTSSEVSATSVSVSGSLPSESSLISTTSDSDSAPTTSVSQTTDLSSATLTVISSDVSTSLSGSASGSQPSESSDIGTKSHTTAPSTSISLIATLSSTTSMATLSVVTSTSQSVTASTNLESTTSGDIPSASDSTSGTSLQTEAHSSSDYTSSQTDGAQTEDLTTSTIFSTGRVTVTACPSGVENCPTSDRLTVTTTQVVAISTTVCPVSETTETFKSTPYGEGSASRPTISVIYTTRLVTVTQCPSGIPDCPASAKTTSIQSYVVPVGAEINPTIQVAKDTSLTAWYSEFTESAKPIQPADSKIYVSTSTGQPHQAPPSASRQPESQPVKDKQLPESDQASVTDGTAKPSAPAFGSETIERSVPSNTEALESSTNAAGTSISTDTGAVVTVPPTVVSGSTRSFGFNLYFLLVPFAFAAFELVT
ncbi:hypothetical protein NM208_g1113 [Fusarium decemcellulare]|uniref:Uncharacterized protein n=2 Tax=Fusarium decemcellulare TaxID=57161 RepID=A0ACC1SX12_9HYPO|nr:hypothetical protein NM208_g1113 [Fusarium decemcellulare]